MSYPNKTDRMQTDGDDDSSGSNNNDAYLDDLYDYEDEDERDLNAGNDTVAMEADDLGDVDDEQDYDVDGYDEVLYSSEDDEETIDQHQFNRIVRVLRLSNQMLLEFMRTLPQVGAYDKHVTVMVKEIAARKDDGETAGKDAYPVVIQQGTDWPALAQSLHTGKDTDGQKPTVYEFDYSIWPGAATHRVPFRGRQLLRPDYRKGHSWPALAQALHELALALGAALAPGNGADAQERLGNRVLATAILYILQGRGAEVQQVLNDCHFTKTAQFESLVLEFLALTLGVETTRLPFATIDVLLHLSNIANARGFGPQDKPYTFLNVFSSVRRNDAGKLVHTYITGMYTKRGDEVTQYQGFSTAPQRKHTEKYTAYVEDDTVVPAYKSQKSVGKSTFSHSAGHDRLQKVFDGDKAMIAHLLRQVSRVGKDERRSRHERRIYFMSPLRAYNLFANLLSTCDNKTLSEETVATELIELLRTFLQGQRCSGQNIFAGFLATSNHCTFGNAVLALELAEKIVAVDEKLYDLAVTALKTDQPGQIMFMIDHSPKLMVPVVVKLLSHESKQYRDPLIHFAVLTGRLDVVQFVLSAGGNPFETDRKGKTVLALALEMGLKEIAECLVAAQDRQRDTQSTILPNAWSFQDFKVDDRWLTDQEVNQLLLNHTPLPHDTYLAPAVDVVAHPGVLAGFIRDNYWSQVRQLQHVCKYTVIPINFHNAHWATVIIVQNPGNPSQPTVLFFDPLGGTPEKRRLIRRVLQMTGIYLAPVIGDLSTWVQVDGFTCGSWMVAAAEIITSGVESGAQLKDIKKALRALAAGMKDRHAGNLKKFGR